jgi:hypothetical protein
MKISAAFEQSEVSADCDQCASKADSIETAPQLAGAVDR